MRRSATCLACVGVLLLARPIQSQSPSHEGHDTPAGAPRLGTIRFPTSATNPAEHELFVTGVLLMHNFHYPRAQAAFRKAQALDPNDVMAYWGEALSYTHPVWNEQDAPGARAVLARLGPTREARLAKARTARERAWLDAVETLYAGDGSKAQRDTAYAAAMEKLHAADPSDDEATTLYALSLLGLNQGARDVKTYEKAYALVLPIFKAHPQHPGAAHYLIHAVDDPEHARLGLVAARSYSEIAPSAVHAIHMTSHIFLARGMWDDLVAANERAQAAVTGGRLSGHVVDWLHYGLLQQGRYREAAHWVDTVASTTRRATGAQRGDGWDALAYMSAANVVDTHDWRSAAAGTRMDTVAITPEEGPLALDAINGAEFGMALAALHRGDRAVFDSALTRMAARRAAATSPTMVNDRGWSEVMEKVLRGYALESDGRNSEALALFRDAAAQDEHLPMQFGPPSVIKPPREAAGELLLDMHRPSDARKEFMLALARAPARSRALLGLARAERALGRSGDARRHYEALAANWRRADSDLPELAEVKAGAARGSVGVRRSGVR